MVTVAEWLTSERFPIVSGSSRETVYVSLSSGISSLTAVTSIICEQIFYVGPIKFVMAYSKMLSFGKNQESRCWRE